MFFVSTQVDQDPRVAGREEHRDRLDRVGGPASPSHLRPPAAVHLQQLRSHGRHLRRSSKLHFTPRPLYDQKHARCSSAWHVRLVMRFDSFYLLPFIM